MKAVGIIWKKGIPITTNKAEYANYADVKKSIEDMIESASKNPVKYMVIYPELKDFKTNMNVSYSDQWLNTRSYGYYSGGTKWKDVFAVAVDTKYPIQDQFTDERNIAFYDFQRRTLFDHSSVVDIGGRKKTAG